MEWLIANGGTIIVCVVLLCLLGLVIWHMVRSRKRGGCAGCPHAGTCSTCSAEAKKADT